MTNGSGPSGNPGSERRLNLRHILDLPIDEQYKSFPSTHPTLRISDVAAQRWNALQAPFSTPLMVLKYEALYQNLQLMRDYCARHNVSLAPHCKTPLSPQLARLQLDADAWALTIANVHQAKCFAEPEPLDSSSPTRSSTLQPRNGWHRQGPPIPTSRSTAWSTRCREPNSSTHTSPGARHRGPYLSSSSWAFLVAAAAADRSTRPSVLPPRLRDSTP
jgi:hypothetical protein